jgi:PAS domain S-box-containing protein
LERNRSNTRLFKAELQDRTRRIAMLESRQPEELLSTALSAFEAGNGYATVLDRLAVPVYMTDAEGRVTYWNQACIDFAGREPQLGRDRWCVTWQLYTMSGERLPHEQCPMATAIKEGRAVRDEIAIALRPDGSRVAFRPYPTPLFDDHGKLTGAINMLVDISEEQSEALKEQAARCRRLARSTNDTRTSDILKSMASGYEETAASLDHD